MKVMLHSEKRRGCILTGGEARNIQGSGFIGRNPNAADLGGMSRELRGG